MKVKDLRDLMNSISDEMDDCNVILQRDPEGNGYSPLSGMDNCIYDQKSGEIYDLKWTAYECCLDEKEWDDMKNDNNKKCIVLYPKY